MAPAPSGASGADASAALGALMQACHRQLAAAGAARDAAAALRPALELLVRAPPPEGAPHPPPALETLPPALADVLGRAAATPGGWAALRAAFFRHHFEAWADAALAACAAAWPPIGHTRGDSDEGSAGNGDSGEGELRRVVEAALLEAPADGALRALVGWVPATSPWVGGGSVSALIRHTQG
jgi:hypothetical protein